MESQARNALLPTRSEERTQTCSMFALSWSSNIIALFSFMTGAAGIAAGLNIFQALCAVLLGKVISLILTILNGTPGFRYGVPMVIQMNACFGERLAPFAAMTRALPAIAWTGYNSFLGALGLNLFSIILFGYNNIWVWLFVFHFAQIVLAGRGIKKMLDFTSYAALALFVLIVIMAVYIVQLFGLESIQKMAVTGGSWGFAFWGIVATSLSGDITCLVNSSDYNREIKNDSYYKMCLAWLFGSLPVVTVMSLLGMFTVAASGIWSPIDLFVQYVPNFALVIVAMIFIILGQFSTNLFANIMPANIIWNRVFKFPWWFCSVFSGCVSLFIVPWYLTTADGFIPFMNTIGAILGPIAGIMLTDFWLLRRQVLNVEQLYKGRGQYFYSKGINIASLIAMILGTILAFWNLQFSSIFGMISGAVIYYILFRCLVLPKYPQAEVSSVHSINMEKNN